MTTWKDILQPQYSKPYFTELMQFLKQRREEGAEIYPKSEDIFKAFQLTPFEKVKVVILGQDPYHGEGQAHGLAFSVPEGTKIPPSLRNIFKEKGESPTSGNLEAWAKEGILLLNSVLTVEAGNAGSHRNRGWESFTDHAIKALSDEREGILFILWGAYAQSKEHLIDTSKHRVLKSVHPSPLSAHRGFFGNGHFKEIEEHLNGA